MEFLNFRSESSKVLWKEHNPLEYLVCFFIRKGGKNRCTLYNSCVVQVCAVHASQGQPPGGQHEQSLRLGGIHGGQLQRPGVHRGCGGCQGRSSSCITPPPPPPTPSASSGASHHPTSTIQCSGSKSNALNVDPDPEFWLDLDSELGPDPGLCYQFEKKILKSFVEKNNFLQNSIFLNRKKNCHWKKFLVS